MPRRSGGLTEAEIAGAVRAVLGAEDEDALYRLVSDMPALSNPIVHAELRHGYQSVVFETEAQRVAFRGRYTALFRILHERSYLQVLGADPAMLATELPAAPSAWIGPQLISETLQLLGDRVPDDAAMSVALSDSDRVRAEVAGLLRHPVELPEYVPPPGTRWHVLLVRCPRCGTRYLAARAWLVDLVVAPELSTTVHSGRLNRTRCPRCAAIPCVPIRLWLGETTGPPDLLACLSTLVRASPSVHLYIPPPATPRTAVTERLLEIRATALITIANLDDTPVASRAAEERDDRQRLGHMVVAYTSDELSAAIQHFTAEAARKDSELIQIVRLLARGLKEGLAYADAEVRAETLTANLAAARIPLDDSLRTTDPVAYLANALVVQALARRHGTPDERVLIARMLSNAYLGLSEPALAERMLIEAEDALAALSDPADDLRTLVEEGRMDLLRSLGRHSEADSLYRMLAASLPSSGTSIDDRRRSLEIESGRWVSVPATSLGSAMRAFPARKTQWRALLEDIDTNDTARRLAVQAAYSGDLANHAANLTSAAHWMRALELVPPDGTEMTDANAAAFRNLPIDFSASDDVIPELLEVVQRILQIELSSAALYQLARADLESAIEMAQAAEHWEFVTIQAHRLMNLCMALGDPDSAARFGELTISTGTRIGNHHQVRSAARTLAIQQIETGAVDDALKYFDRAALEAMRELVGLGHGESAHQSSSIEEVAMRLLLHAPDAARVVASLESVRGARTANAVLLGLPRSELASLAAARQRLQHLRLQLGPQPSAEARADVARAEAEVDAIERSASLRSPAFGRFVDASKLALSTVDDLRAVIARNGQSVWISVIEHSGLVCSIAVSNTAVSRPAFFTGTLAREEWTTFDRTEVGAALLEPHSELIGGLRRDDVIIVSLPEGMRGLPVGGLILNRRPLCASVASVCVTGLSIFEVAAERDLAPTKQVLALAPHRDDRLALAGALNEVKAIGTLMARADRKVTVLSGPAANIRNLVARAADADVVHIACHGEIDAATGELALLLASDPAADDSGWLTEGRVVSELRLRPGAIVNLAGCRTADVRGSSGPVLGGLVPAMLVAGAHSVIASLWPIGDRETEVLQARIYANLVARMRPAQALAAAQDDAWAGRLGTNMIDAQQWAAFVVYGGT